MGIFLCPVNTLILLEVTHESDIKLQFQHEKLSPKQTLQSNDKEISTDSVPTKSMP